ncbi:hypothetical protein ACG2K1_11140 [Neisseria sp. 23W00296]|uniref:hypothetical protein n=1 Tax=unclassified Neisseria TaxID=2623750 RepID=UPI0037567CF5
MENTVMNIRSAALAAAALFALAACDTKVSNPQSADAAPAAASEAAAEAPAPAVSAQTLTSRDGAVSISVTGNFQDQSGNAGLLPEGTSAEEVTLLQRDEDADITLSVIDLGKPAKPAKEYYAGLKSALQAAELADLKAGAATENRMDYSFTQADGSSENCIAIYHPENLYTVCANSATAGNARLAEALKDVKLLKKAM